jgi:putative DNA primase/helicase
MTQRSASYSPEHIQALKDRVPLSSLVGSSIALEKDGHEFRALCPFHNENTPSFTVNDEKRFFHCFGCGAHGDHIDWLVEYRKMEFRDAVRFLEEWTGMEAQVIQHPRTKPAPAADPEWQPIHPIPEDTSAPHDGRGAWRLYNPKRAGTEKEWTTLRPVHVAAYRNSVGRPLGYVLRCEFEDGKFTPQVTWCINSAGERRWCIYPFSEPRPLYGLDRLAAKPSATVLIVEGEKKCDAAQELLPDLAVIAWPGGGNGRAHVDMTPLVGRKAMIWPDADLPGFAAAEGDVDRRGQVRPGIAQMALERGAAGVRIIEPPRDVPNGWDIGDAIKEGWSADRLRQFMRDNLRLPRDPGATAPAARSTPNSPITTDAPPPDDSPPPPDDPDEPGPDDGDPYDGGGDGTDPWQRHFRPLGFHRKTFFLMPARGGQVIDFTGAALKDIGSLLMLAPLSFWEREFPSRKGAVQGPAATNAIINACYLVGPYKPDMVRGRGAWWDNGRSVVHVGDELIVDGQERPLAGFDSDYIYERGIPLRGSMRSSDMLAAAEAKKLLDLCCRLPWERTLSGYLLAGWIVLAPICGAIDWRPSIWITGPSGCGKSWALRSIAIPLVGEWGIFAEGDSSARGIEQEIKYDARPVFFDEADAEDERRRNLMQEMMFLIRVSASSNGGRQFKGTTDGRGRSSQLRTCFALSSINASVDKLPDEARISVLPMVKNDDPGAFKEIKRAAKEIVTPAYAGRLLARSIRLIPIIRKNADTFSDAATELFGSRRVGDQIGALLAGAFALHSGREIDLDKAKAWLAGKDVSEYTVLTAESDEERFLLHLLQHRVRVMTSNTTYEVTLGELVARAAGANPDSYLRTQEAVQEIRRYGLKIDGGGFWVSTTHPALRAILKGTPWAANWGQALRRIPGHRRMRPRESMNFGPGAKTPAVWVPIGLLHEA